MSEILHFHVGDLESLFHVIGSADRDLLLDIGVQLGTEYRPPTDEEADDTFGDEEAEEPMEWDPEEQEQDTAKEIVTKMIMTALPHDLSEDEAYAVQEYFALSAQRSDEVDPLEAEDVVEEIQANHGDDTAEAVRAMLLNGMEMTLAPDFLEWLEGQGVSHELLLRVQMLLLGRLPEADEPTFTDLEDETYPPRFSYLYSHEAANIADEMEEWAAQAPEEVAPMAHAVAAALHYSAAHGRDLVVTMEG